jgi:hypothetical protein
MTMKKLKLTSFSAVLGLGLLAMAGCTTHETKIVRTEPAVVKETTVIEKTAPTVVERPVASTTTTTTETTVVDHYRGWWNTYHPGEPYDADRAMALHHAWCMDHTLDPGCAN